MSREPLPTEYALAVAHWAMKDTNMVRLSPSETDVRVGTVAVECGGCSGRLGFIPIPREVVTIISPEMEAHVAKHYTTCRFIRSRIYDFNAALFKHFPGLEPSWRALTGEVRAAFMRRFLFELGCVSHE